MEAPARKYLLLSIHRRAVVNRQACFLLFCKWCKQPTGSLAHSWVRQRSLQVSLLSALGTGDELTDRRPEESFSIIPEVPLISVVDTACLNSLVAFGFWHWRTEPVLVGCCLVGEDSGLCAWFLMSS